MAETEAPSAGRKKGWIGFAIKAVISIALIGYIFYAQVENVDDIWTAMAAADPVLLLLAFSLNTVGYLLCSWRWQILLAAQGFVVPLIELIRAYTIGIFFNVLLPGLMSGDFMRAMDVSDRVPSYARSFLILFVERLTGMFGLVFLALFALPLIGWELVEKTKIGWILAAVSAVLLAVSVVFFNQNLRRWLEPIERVPVLKKLTSIAQKVAETSDAFRTRMRAIYACMGISIVFQANVVLHYYLIGAALGIDVPLYAYFAIIPVSHFVMMIPASINGIGIREQIFIFLFGQFGVAAAASVSLAWIALGMVLIQAVAGGIVFALRRKKMPTGVEAGQSA